MWKRGRSDVDHRSRADFLVDDGSWKSLAGRTFDTKGIRKITALIGSGNGHVI